MRAVENNYDLHLVGGTSEDRSSSPKYLCLDLLPTESRVLSLGLGPPEDNGFEGGMLNAGHKVVGVDPSVPSCYAATLLGRLFTKFIFMSKAVTKSSGLTKARCERTNDFEKVGHFSQTYFNKSEQETYKDVESTSLGDLIELFGGFDVLKVNIEGYEYEVIDSIKNMDIAQVLISFNHNVSDKYTLDDTLACVEKMEDMGYETLDLHTVDPDWIKTPSENFIFIKPSSSKKISI
jgi:FkbM family methyltransferase